MKKIATWNVASVRSRMEGLGNWLTKTAPDIVFLQEVKATEESFPFLEIKGMGYNALVRGQKSYNGVAVLSKEPLEPVLENLPGAGEEEARYLEVKDAAGVHYISVYVPNGNPSEKNPQDTSKLEYKLRFMAALLERVQTLLADRTPFVLGGDFNVIARDTDVYNAKAYEGNALMLPSVREALRKIEYSGVTNALRLLHPEPFLYSFWDYRFGAWEKNMGMLLDILYLSPAAADKLEASGTDSFVRGEANPSDHVPVWCLLRE